MLLTLARLAADARHTVWIEGLGWPLMEQGLEALVQEGLAGIRLSYRDLDPVQQAAPAQSAIEDLVDELAGIDETLNAATVQRWLLVTECRQATDRLASVFHASHGRNGYCTAPIPADALNDARSIIEAARSLRMEVDRPNLMVEIPGNPPGVEALEVLIAEGVSVSINPVVEPERHEQIMDAYRSGLARNPDPRNVASVACVPIGLMAERIDEALVHDGGKAPVDLVGKGGAGCAERLYRQWSAFFDAPAFQREASRGAHRQRLAWNLRATDKVDPVRVWSSLIYPETVALVDMPTLEAFLQGGSPRPATHTGASGDLITRIGQQGVNVEVLCTEIEMELVDNRQAEYRQVMNDIAAHLG